MIESPYASLLTACLFLFTAGFPVFIVFSLYNHYWQKKSQLSARTTIPEVTTAVKTVNDHETIANSLLSPANTSKDGAYSIISAVKYVPKDHKKTKNHTPERPNAGEDAFFTYSPQDKSSNFIGAMGIADGVGGYADLGVDASLIAWQLMENVRDNFDKNRDLDSIYTSPREVLHRAFETILFKGQVACGGTTACLVSVFKNDIGELFLQYANLGDSGFMVVRNGQVLFRTTDQTHYFNAPYQLAIPPKGRTVIMNEANDADQFQMGKYLPVQDGDYIIMATDGLWDNIFDEDVIDILTANIKKHNSRHLIVEATCEEMLKRTSAVSINSPRPVLTPFQRYATDNKRNWIGGKIDDISIIVGCISMIK
jgi:protein phosphatase PTC7